MDAPIKLTDVEVVVVQLEKVDKGLAGGGGGLL